VSTLDWLLTVSTLEWLLTCVSTVEWFVTVSTLDWLLTCVSTVNGQVLLTVPNYQISKFSQSFFRISKMEQAQKIAWFIQNTPPEADGAWLPVRPGIAKSPTQLQGAYFSESKIFLIWIPKITKFCGPLYLECFFFLFFLVIVEGV